jgi:hypothetical protein
MGRGLSNEQRDMLREIYKEGCIQGGGSPSGCRTVRRLIARGLVEWYPLYEKHGYELSKPRERSGWYFLHYIQGFYMLTQAGRDTIPQVAIKLPESSLTVIANQSSVASDR